MGEVRKDQKHFQEGGVLKVYCASRWSAIGRIGDPDPKNSSLDEAGFLMEVFTSVLSSWSVGKRAPMSAAAVKRGLAERGLGRIPKS